MPFLFNLQSYFIAHVVTKVPLVELPFSQAVLFFFTVESRVVDDDADTGGETLLSTTVQVQV